MHIAYDIFRREAAISDGRNDDGPRTRGAGAVRFDA